MGVRVESGLMSRWFLGRWDVAVDVVLVGALVAGTGLSLLLQIPAGVSVGPRGASLSVEGWVASLAQVIPLLWRRRAGLVVLGVVWLATLAVHALSVLPTPANAGLLIALYSAAAWAPSRAALALSGWVAGVGAVLDQLGLAAAGSPLDPFRAAVYTIFLAAFWTNGAVRRARRLYVEDLHCREEEMRAQRRAAERDAAEERLRLAREVHDVVTSHVTAMVMQTSAVKVRLGTAPDSVEDGLNVIADTGREALGELRSVLSLLREDRSAGKTAAEAGALLSESAEVLARRTIGIGRVVSAIWNGPRQGLPTEVDAAAYRVAQEALTNAAKHGLDGPVEFVVNRTAGELVITVRNPAVPDADTDPGVSVAPSPGFGLRGMRERIDHFGGSLQAGFSSEIGRPEYVVRARFPIARAASRELDTDAATTEPVVPRKVQPFVQWLRS